jgi:hypothetical protein
VRDAIARCNHQAVVFGGNDHIHAVGSVLSTWHLASKQNSPRSHEDVSTDGCGHSKCVPMVGRGGRPARPLLGSWVCVHSPCLNNTPPSLAALLSDPT